MFETAMRGFDRGHTGMAARAAVLLGTYQESVMKRLLCLALLGMFTMTAGIAGCRAEGEVGDPDRNRVRVEGDRDRDRATVRERETTIHRTDGDTDRTRTRTEIRRD